MKKALAKTKEYGSLIAILITLIGVCAFTFRLWSVPARMDALDGRMDTLDGRMDELEKQVQALRIEHGERLARIEGALFGVAPVSSDSAAAPVEPVEEGAFASVPSASKIRGGVKK